jgi:hypothetical protein
MLGIWALASWLPWVSYCVSLPAAASSSSGDGGGSSSGGGGGINGAGGGGGAVQQVKNDGIFGGVLHLGQHGQQQQAHHKPHGGGAHQHAGVNSNHHPGLHGHATHGHHRANNHSTAHRTHADWLSVPMPTMSLFAGFEPPTDSERWQRALHIAASGEQVLLTKVLQTIKSPLDLFVSMVDNVPWFERIAEMKRSMKHHFLKDLPVTPHNKASIVTLGENVYKNKGWHT